MQTRHTRGRWAMVAILVVLPVAVRRAVEAELVATAQHVTAAAHITVGALTALCMDVVDCQNFNHHFYYDIESVLLYAAGCRAFTC